MDILLPLFLQENRGRFKTLYHRGSRFLPSYSSHLPSNPSPKSPFQSLSLSPILRVTIHLAPPFPPKRPTYAYSYTYTDKIPSPSPNEQMRPFFRVRRDIGFDLLTPPPPRKIISNSRWAPKKGKKDEDDGRNMKKEKVLPLALAISFPPPHPLPPPYYPPLTPSPQPPRFSFPRRPVFSHPIPSLPPSFSPHPHTPPPIPPPFLTLSPGGTIFPVGKKRAGGKGFHFPSPPLPPLPPPYYPLPSLPLPFLPSLSSPPFTVLPPPPLPNRKKETIFSPPPLIPIPFIILSSLAIGRG